MNITLEKPEEIEITKWNNYLPTLQKIVEKMEAVGIEILKINSQKSTSYYDYFKVRYCNTEFNLSLVALSRLNLQCIFYVFDRMDEIIKQADKVSYEGVFYSCITSHVKNIVKTGNSSHLIFSIICSILQEKKIRIWS
jgi:hypothetical protein